MITARQSRAARALLGWTQETLADKARVSLTALKRLESDSGLEVYESCRDQVRRAFEGNGIVLLNSGHASCYHSGQERGGFLAQPWRNCPREVGAISGFFTFASVPVSGRSVSRQTAGSPESP
ncbi:helix-turn-helix transcriptional regulator [Aureimonas sp. OT7]|nr:helix-turn-helix transcriptional regulator [Aureimonas sp. OT7]